MHLPWEHGTAVRATVKSVFRFVSKLDGFFFLVSIVDFKNVFCRPVNSLI